MCVSICADLYYLAQEEAKKFEKFETECSKKQKSKGVQHRIRTTFTPEQSRALEQGDLKSL